MRRQREREEFIRIMTRQVPAMSLDEIRKVMRESATLQRLAVALCNGDWPCDNGDRETRPCPACENAYVPSAIRGGQCPDCRAEARVRKLCAPYGITPTFQGDPRGCVLKLALPEGREVCVP